MSSFNDGKQTRQTMGQRPQMPYQGAQTSYPNGARSPKQPGLPQRVPPMSKGRALELVDNCKRWIVVTSLVGFGTLGALILSNMPTSSASANQITPASNANQPAATATPDDSNTGGFFQQQGGGGVGPGNGPQGGGQGPTSGSHSS